MHKSPLWWSSNWTSKFRRRNPLVFQAPGELNMNSSSTSSPASLFPCRRGIWWPVEPKNDLPSLILSPWPHTHICFSCTLKEKSTEKLLSGTAGPSTINMNPAAAQLLCFPAVAGNYGYSLNFCTDVLHFFFRLVIQQYNHRYWWRCGGCGWARNEEFYPWILIMTFVPRIFLRWSRHLASANIFCCHNWLLLLCPLHFFLAFVSWNS